MRTHNLRTVINLGWITGDQVAVVMDALSRNPQMDVCGFMREQGWLDDHHIAWLQKEATAHILQTAANLDWLTEDQVRTAAAAVAADPALSVYEFLQQQGWLGVEHVAWLQQQEAAAADTSVQPLPQTDEGSAVAESVPTAGVQLLPTDANFPVSLGTDQALAHLDDYLRLGQYYGSSDVHIGVGAPPIMRRQGCLQVMWPGAPPFTKEQTERLLMEFLADPQKERLRETGDLDFCYDRAGLGRFRTSVVKQRTGTDGVFRIISTKVRTMDELGLPPHLKGLTNFHNGLILVTGSVGSGKSTTLAAFVEEINRNRHDHIITLEDPVEYVFEPHGCHITQREVHTHTKSFAIALRAALREDPDVIMVGEMRDLETISLAITAAETGHLVLGTLHTSTAARTLDRVLDVFPVDQQSQIRTMIGGSLRGVVSQQLVPRADGKGRVLALEILVNFPAVAALIRDGKTYMLPGVMQTGKKAGCRLMDESLQELLTAKTITAQDAYERAVQKAIFKEYL